MENKIKRINNRFQESDLVRVKEYELEVARINCDFYRLYLVDTQGMSKVLYEGSYYEVSDYLAGFEESIWLMNGGY